ncbi:thioesterase II family protein [Psychromicrobium lacuslunae]|uniref:Thioesterase TesA-like domain-containing protein n=1 Tax=Psychromicrobium lacuslunae TaxID=1618207 RepID=A0A0D4C1V3_9MICC|nr:alpha/beta fold hydrolase [Psychromicrobium lacuslunae]AJT42514.1 hypothetical protein UM93_15290 [Psychromicrobium lacuslunae]
MNTTQAETAPWLRSLRRSEGAGFARLIVFPHSAAGPASLEKFYSTLPSWLELYGVVAPGRENRFTEPLASDASQLIAEVVAELAELPSLPTVLFGHSLGALLAPLVALNCSHLVEGLVLSGLAPKQVHQDSMELIRQAGLTPDELLGDEGWHTHLAALVDADGAVAEQAKTLLARTVVEHPALVIGGDSDPFADPKGLEDWRLHVNGTVEIRTYPGDHFFMLDPASTSQVAEDVAQAIAGWLRGDLW